MKQYVIGEDGTGQLETRGGIKLFGGTSRHEYEYLILEGISKGFGKPKDLLKFIETEFSENFNEVDNSPILDGCPRWKRNAQWKMYLMKKQDLLQHQKKKKIWVLTDMGQRRLNEIKGINKHN